MASVVNRTRVFLTAARVESGDGTTTQTERRRSKDVREAAFALTCLFSDETEAIWQLLNIEAELKLKYRCHQGETTISMLVSTLSIFESTLMFGANAVMQHE